MSNERKNPQTTNMNAGGKPQTPPINPGTGTQAAKPVTSKPVPK